MGSIGNAPYSDKDVIGFIRLTQPKEWEHLANLQKDKVEETLIDDPCQALNSEHEDCLSVLRRGFKCCGFGWPISPRPAT